MSILPTGYLYAGYSPSTTTDAHDGVSDHAHDVNPADRLPLRRLLAFDRLHARAAVAAPQPVVAHRPIHLVPSSRTPAIQSLVRVRSRHLPSAAQPLSPRSLRQPAGSQRARRVQPPLVA